MRIAEVNMMHVGSTGKIMFGIAEIASSLGNEVHTFSPIYYEKGKKMDAVEIHNHLYFGTLRETIAHYIFAEITGFHGFGSYFGTKQLIQQLKKIQPDIIHLHNLHNFTINIPELFSYIKKEKVKTVWTLHDCWAMTGKCPYFDLVECEKWKTGCNKCLALHDYPKAYIDQVRLMWKLKRKWFTGIDNMTLVTPSKWLANIVQESFLSDYPVKVIHNGIDLRIFTPSHNKEIYQKYKIPHDKHIVLGVAFDWGKRKGLDVFIELAKRLSNEYQIIMVGTNDVVDQILPSQILSIHRTQDQKELASLYSIADVFINPTREDNFPTVNLESLACGTPVITFNTGGSPESINNHCGICIEIDDIDNLERSIYTVCENHLFTTEKCIENATLFSQRDKFTEYVRLFEQIVAKG